MDGIERMQAKAQELVKLAEFYPNGETKAVCLRAAALLFEHAARSLNEGFALRNGS